jgi:hypothetical protein
MFARRYRPAAAPAVPEPAPVADHPRATGPVAVLERAGATVATWSLRLLLTGAAVADPSPGGGRPGRHRGDPGASGE